MPFSRRRHGRKRGFHDSKADCQEITYFRRQDMNVPTNNVGINPAQRGYMPQIPNGTGIVATTAGVMSGPYVAEATTSNYIGIYKFDFTRWLYSTFGRPFEPVTSDPRTWQHSFVSYFKYLRFGTATMRIERIDYGANTQMVTMPMESPINPQSNPVSSPTPQRSRLWWLRVDPHDPSFDPTLLSPQMMRCHPRVRFAIIKARSSIKFKFHPIVFTPARYTVNMSRQYNNTTTPTQEGDQMRRVEMPSRYHRLGFIPTSLVLAAYEKFSQNFPATQIAFTGVNPSMHRILSPSILFMWEEELLGNYTASAGPEGPAAIYAISQILIRRSESCSVTFRGLIPFQNATWYNGSSQQEACDIGAVEYTVPFNQPLVTGGITLKTVEICDPPRSSSILNTPGQDPLYRYNDPVANYTSTLVPLDISEGVAPYNTPGFPNEGPQGVPPVGGIP